MSIPEYERTFSEVIISENGGQKFRVDIDDNVDNIYEIKETMKNMLEIIGINKPSLLLFDIETSYHIVLTNYHFVSNEQCKRIAIYLSSKIKSIDLGIYNKLQHLRLEGCTKFGQKRWKRRTTYPLTINNFHEGVISSTEGTVLSMVFLPHVHKPKSTTKSGIPWDLSSYPEYVVRFHDKDLIVLDRIRSSHCSQCERTHDKEGAYVLKGILYCRRKLETK